MFAGLSAEVPVLRLFPTLNATCVRIILLHTGSIPTPTISPVNCDTILDHPVSHTTKSQKCSETAVETLCIIDEEALRPSESDVLSTWLNAHQIREGTRRVVAHGINTAGTATDESNADTSGDEDETASIRSSGTSRSSLSGVLAAEPAIVVAEGAWKQPETFYRTVGAVRSQMESKLATYLGKPVKAGASDETVIQAYYYMQKQASPTDIEKFINSSKSVNGAGSNLVLPFILVSIISLIGLA